MLVKLVRRVVTGDKVHTFKRTREWQARLSALRNYNYVRPRERYFTVGVQVIPWLVRKGDKFTSVIFWRLSE